MVCRELAECNEFSLIGGRRQSWENRTEGSASSELASFARIDCECSGRYGCRGKVEMKKQLSPTDTHLVEHGFLCSQVSLILKTPTPHRQIRPDTAGMAVSLDAVQTSATTRAPNSRLSLRFHHAQSCTLCKDPATRQRRRYPKPCSCMACFARGSACGSKNAPQRRGVAF